MINLLSQQASWDTNCTTLIEFQNNLQETTYIITRNINMTCLQANTTRRTKRYSGCCRWPPLSLQSSTILYWWPPLSLQSPMISYTDCWVRVHPVVRMQISPVRTCDRRLGVVRILIKTIEEMRCYWHNPNHSAWPWRWRANSFEKTESLTQRCVCVGCQLKSDHALRLLCLKGHVEPRSACEWIDAVTTPVDKKRINSCIFKLKYLFLREFSNKKIRQKPPEILSPTRY